MHQCKLPGVLATKIAGTLGWVIVAILGLLVLALLPALSLFAYLHGFGVATASSLVFAEAAVDVVAGLVPVTMLLRRRSIASVIAAETATSAVTVIAVSALLAVAIGRQAASAIPIWWIAGLAVRRACIVVSSHLTAPRKQLVGGHAIMMMVAMVVRAVVAFATGSVAAMIAVASALELAILLVIVRVARRHPLDPGDARPPIAWGAWLTRVAGDVPLPLAVMWFGGVSLAAPLAATAYVSTMCWIPFLVVLETARIERGVRMILAAGLVVVFALVEHALAPGAYQRLFPALALHREWFDALAWAGVLLLAVPLPPAWQLSRSERARAVTALLGLAVVLVAAALGGLTALVLGAAVNRALQWRPEEPSKPAQ